MLSVGASDGSLKGESDNSAKHKAKYERIRAKKRKKDPTRRSDIRLRPFLLDRVEKQKKTKQTNSRWWTELVGAAGDATRLKRTRLRFNRGGHWSIPLEKFGNVLPQQQLTPQTQGDTKVSNTTQKYLMAQNVDWDKNYKLLNIGSRKVEMVFSCLSSFVLTKEPKKFHFSVVVVLYPKMEKKKFLLSCN